MVSRASLFVWALIGLNSGLHGASITSQMLVQMRTITSVSRSPDGEWAVVGVNYANLQSNKNEPSWVVVPIHVHRSLVTVPGGDEIFDPASAGAMLNSSVVWRSDSRVFYFLRREGAEVQLWKSDLDGTSVAPVTHSKADVLGVRETDHGGLLRLSLAPDRDMLNTAEVQEDRQGILYDDHILGSFPLTHTLPMIDRWRNSRRLDNGDWVPTGWTGLREALFDISSGRLDMLPDPVSQHPESKDLISKHSVVSVVPLQEMPKGPLLYTGQYALRAEMQNSHESAKTCIKPQCVAPEITLLGWSSDDTEVYYLTDSMQGRIGRRLPGKSALYAWNPQRDHVRTIVELDDRFYTLDGAYGLMSQPPKIVDNEVIFAETGIDQPPKLVAVELSRGRMRTLYDPNPELRKLTAGRAAWHQWPSRSFYPVRGVVILPDDYTPGKRYPLIVTSYVCGRGFLRGGGNDNAPEFVAAVHGFVATCIDVTTREIHAREPDLSRIYSIMCDMISDLIAGEVRDGIVDPTRVGLSGHSLGANAGAYCISHSREFAAAALRGGSALERSVWDLFETAEWRRDPVNGVYAMLSMPDPRHDPTGKWDRMSVAKRASEIETPLLMQTDDEEYVDSLPLYSAMHELHKVVEMYVYPSESHVLIQPVHRLLNYERQMDWFRYWIKGEKDDAPDKQQQYLRWKQLGDAAPPR